MANESISIVRVENGPRFFRFSTCFLFLWYSRGVLESTTHLWQDESATMPGNVLVLVATFPCLNLINNTILLQDTIYKMSISIKLHIYFYFFLSPSLSVSFSVEVFAVAVRLWIRPEDYTKVFFRVLCCFLQGKEIRWGRREKIMPADRLWRINSEKSLKRQVLSQLIRLYQIELDKIKEYKH